MTSKFLVRLVAALSNAALAYAIYLAFLATEKAYPPFGMTEVSFIGVALVVSLITYLAAREDSPLSFTWLIFGIVPTLGLVIVAALAVWETLPATLPATLVLGDKTVFLGVVAVLAIFNLGIYFAHVGRRDAVEDRPGAGAPATPLATPTPVRVAPPIRAVSGAKTNTAAAIAEVVIPPVGGYPEDHEPDYVGSETGLPTDVTARIHGIVDLYAIQNEYGEWELTLPSRREVNRLARNRRLAALPAPRASREPQVRRAEEEVGDAGASDDTGGNRPPEIRTAGGDEPVEEAEVVEELPEFLPRRTPPLDEAGAPRLDS